MRIGKSSVFFAVSIVISILLSSTMTIRAMAGDVTYESGETHSPFVLTSDDDGTPEPEETDTALVPTEDAGTPEPGETDAALVPTEDAGTPEGDTDTASVPAETLLENGEAGTDAMVVGDTPVSNSNDVGLGLLEVQDLLSEDIPLVVVVDGYIEPLVTEQAAQAVMMGDPIWCPESSPPIPLAGNCTDSYATLELLINDIVGGIITEPNDHGVIWILTGADLSASPVEIDSADYTNWGSYRLTIQGGWTGTSAGSISGESVFSVPLSILDWSEPVFVNDIDVVNTNSTGLTIDVLNDVSIDNVSSNGNQGAGIDIVTLNGSVSLQNSGAMSNDFVGISITAGGDVSLAGVFTSLNNDTGMFVDAGGSITASDLEANFNGNGGIYGSGIEFYTPGSLTLSGMNYFNNNFSDGLYVDAATGVSIQNAYANNNSGSGYFLGTNGNAGAICGQTLGNGYLQIDTGMTGTLTLTGLDFGGDPDNNVGIDSSQLVLVSNGCFVYPAYYSDSQDEDSGEGETNIPPSPAFDFEMLSFNPVKEVGGEFVRLDCVNYSGTLLTLENGDGVFVPCPIEDTVSLGRLEPGEPPLPLPEGYSYISSMDVYISNNGQAFAPAEASDVVWFFTDNNGYQATYYDGTEWTDITDQLLPFLEIFFVIPDSAQEKDCVIMYWDGIMWHELADGLDLGEGRIIGNVGLSPDKATYQGLINFIGLFVLAEK